MSTPDSRRTPFALFFRGLSAPSGTEQWFWMLFLGFINTGAGCYLYFSDIAKLPVGAVMILAAAVAACKD